MSRSKGLRVLTEGGDAASRRKYDAGWHSPTGPNRGIVAALLPHPNVVDPRRSATRQRSALARPGRYLKTTDQDLHGARVTGR